MVRFVRAASAVAMAVVLGLPAEGQKPTKKPTAPTLATNLPTASPTVFPTWDPNAGNCANNKIDICH